MNWIQCEHKGKKAQNNKAGERPGMNISCDIVTWLLLIVIVSYKVIYFIARWKVYK